MSNIKPQTLPQVWRRKSNGKLYGLGSLVIRAGGRPYVWMYEHDSNRCLHITLERLCRTFAAV